MKGNTATKLITAMMLLLVPTTLTSCKDMSHLAAEILKAMDDIQPETGKEEGTDGKLANNQAAPAGKAYELPAIGKNDLIIRHTAFTLRYNKTHNTPDWVAWCLTAQHTDGPVERSQKFWADPSLPSAYRVDYYDYKGSGYDRGHMCPAGDMKWDEKAMHDCFYMSNICPQTGTLNSGSWNRLEMKCRDWAKKEGCVYIVCGPVWKKGRHEKIGIDHSIDVPEGFFKAVLTMRKGHERTIAYYFRNDESQQSYREAIVTVDEIERRTGLDLFAAVEDNLERKIEAECKQW